MFEGNREEIAKELAVKWEFGEWDKIAERFKDALLHNADLIIEQQKQPEPAPDIVLAKEVVEVVTEVENESAQSATLGLAELAEIAGDSYIPPAGEEEPPLIKKESPATMKPGHYLCNKCQTTHKETSNIGKKHLKYKVVSE